MALNLPSDIPISATPTYTTLLITTHQLPATEYPTQATSPYQHQPPNATTEPTPAATASAIAPCLAPDTQSLALLFDSHQIAAILTVYQALAVSNNTSSIQITLAPGPWAPGINTVLSSIAVAVNVIDVMVTWFR